MSIETIGRPTSNDLGVKEKTTSGKEVEFLGAEKKEGMNSERLSNLEFEIAEEEKRLELLRESQNVLREQIKKTPNAEIYKDKYNALQDAWYGLLLDMGRSNSKINSMRRKLDNGDEKRDYLDFRRGLVKSGMESRASLERPKEESIPGLIKGNEINEDTIDREISRSEKEVISDSEDYAKKDDTLGKIALYLGQKGGIIGRTIVGLTIKSSEEAGALVCELGNPENKGKSFYEIKQRAIRKIYKKRFESIQKQFQKKYKVDEKGGFIYWTDKQKRDLGALLSESNLSSDAKQEIQSYIDKGKIDKKEAEILSKKKLESLKIENLDKLQKNLKKIGSYIDLLDSQIDSYINRGLSEGFLNILDVQELRNQTTAKLESFAEINKIDNEEIVDRLAKGENIKLSDIDPEKNVRVWIRHRLNEIRKIKNDYIEYERIKKKVKREEVEKKENWIAEKWSMFNANLKSIFGKKEANKEANVKDKEKSDEEKTQEIADKMIENIIDRKIDNFSEYSDFVENEDLQSKIALRLIKDGRSTAVIDNLEYFGDKLDPEVGVTLASEKHLKPVYENLDKFSDKEKVIGSMIENGGISYLINADGVFKNEVGKMDRYMAEKIIESQWGYVVAKNLDKFNDLDGKIALELIKIPGAQEQVIKHIKEFKNLMPELAKTLIKMKQVDLVLENIDLFDIKNEQFEELVYETLSQNRGRELLMPYLDRLEKIDKLDLARIKIGDVESAKKSLKKKIYKSRYNRFAHGIVRNVIQKCKEENIKSRDGVESIFENIQFESDLDKMTEDLDIPIEDKNFLIGRIYFSKNREQILNYLYKQLVSDEKINNESTKDKNKIFENKIGIIENNLVSLIDEHSIYANIDREFDKRITNKDILGQINSVFSEEEIKNMGEVRLRAMVDRIRKDMFSKRREVIGEIRSRKREDLVNEKAA